MYILSVALCVLFLIVLSVGGTLYYVNNSPVKLRDLAGALGILAALFLLAFVKYLNILGFAAFIFLTGPRFLCKLFSRMKIDEKLQGWTNLLNLFKK